MGLGTKCPSPVSPVGGLCWWHRAGLLALLAGLGALRWSLAAARHRAFQPGHMHVGFAKYPSPHLPPYRCFKLHREKSVSLPLRPVLNQFN